jgi:hypothetical protein
MFTNVIEKHKNNNSSVVCTILLVILQSFIFFQFTCHPRIPMHLSHFSIHLHLSPRFMCTHLFHSLKHAPTLRMTSKLGRREYIINTRGSFCFHNSYIIMKNCKPKYLYGQLWLYLQIKCLSRIVVPFKYN